MSEDRTESPEPVDLDREKMFHDHLSLANGLAHRFRGRGESVDDLRQVASIGLMKAAERFGPDRGVPFRAYALATMVGEIKRHFRDGSWTVKVPRRVQELSIEIRSVLDVLAQELGRMPTAGEVASYIGETTEVVIEALAATSAYQPESLDGDWEAFDSGNGPVVEPLGELVDSLISIEPGLASLSVQQREVVVLRFFHDLSQRQIAERIGVSQMQVSRLLNRAVQALREWAKMPG